VARLRLGLRRRLRRLRRVDEEGSVSLWVLYWSFIMLFIAGFGVDLWRGVAVRRSLVEQAEAAASAGANGVDTDTFRLTGDVVIDPALAEALANETLAAQGEVELVESATVSVDEATQEVTVELTAEVDFTLIKVFLSGEEPIVVDVAASAAPRIGTP
jgi:Flp pilus assembly protein TadG